MYNDNFPTRNFDCRSGSRPLDTSYFLFNNSSMSISSSSTSLELPGFSHTLEQYSAYGWSSGYTTTYLRRANAGYANVNYKWQCKRISCTAVPICEAVPCTQNRNNNDSKMCEQIHYLLRNHDAPPQSANMFRNTDTSKR